MAGFPETYQFPDLVSVGELMNELRVHSPQRQFLTKHRERAERTLPYGRGYTNYVTKEVADRLRAKVARERTARKAPAQLVLVETKPPEAPAPAPVAGELMEQVLALRAELKALRADLAHWGVTQ